MKTQLCHNIKHRKKANDKIKTPEKLAKFCIDQVLLVGEDIVLDSFAGDKVFFDNYPDFVKKEWCELDKESDFFLWNKKIDWIITNPPYSVLDDVLAHSCDVCNKGFGYLIGLINLTPKRIEFCNQRGFFIEKIHLCKVFKYFGMSIFIVFSKNTNKNVISFDRTVWR